MGLLEIIIIGAGLSMDAFAVAACRGLCMRKVNYRHCLIIALFFGVFQAIMPLIGWILAASFEKYIVKFDHWIAFALLVIIGLKMIWDAFHEDKDDDDTCVIKLSIKNLTVMAVATSIDALAVGISFAFLGMSFGRLLVSVLIIGITTFAISVSGVFLGNRFGIRFKQKAEVAGGFILLLIGVKILLEHLGIINF